MLILLIVDEAVVLVDPEAVTDMLVTANKSYKKSQPIWSGFFKIDSIESILIDITYRRKGVFLLRFAEKMLVEYLANPKC
ncbi:hypothetical protein UP17_09635 [Peribacillus simplex]|uniref:Uncharacterized protein n=1 Tax=Peribacillus simplex TaxID=1478 RepID=A0AAW7IFE9_9BACI|nr:hypothetical protein [Peribacillus simplex]AMM92755.1 hypothetical protein UP17_09635 [Peribacillus simplex]MDM5454084.1 hypothetical protein [Peribacillus simplex]